MPEPRIDMLKPKDVDIRLAEDADHAAIRRLFNEGLLEGQLRDNDTGADIENLREGYFSDDGASAFWVARRRRKLIGMIGVQKTADNTAELRRLRVHPDYRRRGVGSLLMARALDFCRRHGYLKVILDVRIDRPPAIAMLKKFGFAHTRTREIGSRKTLDFYLDIYSEPER
jgi:ribosomal protein S18 acetylase RimI-like enzyme